MGNIAELNKGIEKSSNRNVGLDIVKAVAIFSVVGVHFFLNTNFYKTNLNSTNLFLQTLIQQLFLSCIPLFLLSTGYLNNNTEISKNYFKKLIPILLIYLIYSVIAIMYRVYIKEIDVDVLLWISLILRFKGNRYGWYIDLYIGLFLLIPFLNRMYNSLSTKKEKQILISILVLLTSLVPLVNGKISEYIYLPTYWTSIYPLTYFFVGKYIKDFKPSMKISLNIVSLIIIIFIQGFIEYTQANGGVYKHFLTDYTSLLRLMQGCLIFILFYKCNIKIKCIRDIIKNISSLTLDIYLASFITDRIIYKELLKPYTIMQENYLYIMIPLVISSFILALIISNIRKTVINIR